MRRVFKKRIYLAFLLIVLITASLTHVYSETYAVPNAKVIELYTHPETPIINESTEINIRIRNTGDVEESFKVILYALKNGMVILEKYFIFELKADGVWMNTAEFVPESLGNYKIRAEVWDFYGSRLYDAETIDVRSKSEVGPFDASLDIITSFPYPGKDLIALMTVVNRGREKTDVIVNYRIQETNISGEYTTFLDSESEASSPIFLTAPSKSGLYTLSAEVRYLDSLVASSFEKFFVNPDKYMPMLEMKGVPPAIKIEQGESESLSITVDNIGDDSIHDLQIITKGIPLEWLKRWPSFNHEVEPKGSRIFIVSLDVPENAHVREYPIEFIAAAKETSSKEPSNLVVLGAPAEKIEEEVVKVELSLYHFLSLFIGMIVTIVITIMIIMFLFARRHKESEWAKLREKWGKNKENKE